jgi:hypothetical protein
VSSRNGNGEDTIEQTSIERNLPPNLRPTPSFPDEGALHLVSFYESVYRNFLLYSISIYDSLRYTDTNFGVKTVAATSRLGCYLTVLIYVQGPVLLMWNRLFTKDLCLHIGAWFSDEKGLVTFPAVIAV